MKTHHIIIADYGTAGRQFEEADLGVSFEMTLRNIERTRFDAVHQVIAFEIGGTCSDVTADVALAFSKREWALLGKAARELVERFGLEPDATDRENMASITARTHGTLNRQMQGIA